MTTTKDKYKPVNLWTIYTNNPVGLEFLNTDKCCDGIFFHALSYPTKIIAICDNSNPADQGTVWESTVMDKRCKLDDGSVVLLAWNQIFQTEEEARKVFKTKVSGFSEYIQDIQKLQEFLATC